MGKRDAVIVSAVRSAIARQGGALAPLQAHEFGAIVLQEVLKRANIDPREVDDIILGNVSSGGGNIARLTSLQAGFPFSTTGITIDRQCGSSINAVILAAQAIQAGVGDIFIAGGTESLSRAPYLMDRPTKGYDHVLPKFRPQQLSPKDIGDPPMGITAETLAEKYSITREEQDEFAYNSQQKMANAMRQGYFDEQIVPITIPVRKGAPFIFTEDEHPRPQTTKAGLSKLPPAFLHGGTVSAGNSSGINDGACALVVMSREVAEKRGLSIIAVIRGSSISGVDPKVMGIGPVSAVKSLLARIRMTLNQIDLIECNEAFAAQTLAVDRELQFDVNKLNVNGGAIAHGHPLGATGAVLMTKTIYELARRKQQFGLITACIGGGQGIAILLERES
ncbi:thiolase family protein [Halalkalibacter flavus]|jgi:acetyl-CoA C-acetyltransferase|uniref:thiolase family protein n=1 Tax=Halalkalibacter flavus TaxID=3090668 RepID=UPI002FCA09A4